MGYATWQPLYYATPADQVPEDQALVHSYRKWQGLRPKVLAKHGLTVTGWLIEDEEEGGLRIGGESCALCHHHHRVDAHHDENPCAGCPIERLTDACDNHKSLPWGRWRDRGDPEPMIRALEQAMRDQGLDPAEYQVEDAS